MLLFVVFPILKKQRRVLKRKLMDKSENKTQLHGLCRSDSSLLTQCLHQLKTMNHDLCAVHEFTCQTHTHAHSFLQSNERKSETK